MNSMGYELIKFLKKIDAGLYPITYLLVWPINRVMLSVSRKRLQKSESGARGEEEFRDRPLKIAHISLLFTKPYMKTRALREVGVQADYIVPRGLSWLRVSPQGYDRYLALERLPKVLRPFKECFLFWWRGLTDYDVYHYHFLSFLTESGWDVKYLKKLGKKLVFHFGGCDIREEAVNRQLHPQFNICQECTYDRRYCSGKFVRRKRRIARRYGDLFLVTTPDMRDFIPEAHHLPFMSPPLDPDRISEMERDRSVVRILHTSNHEGIDGTRYLVEAVERLKEIGYRIELVHPRQVAHEEAMRIYQSADIMIDQLLVGWYGGAAVEAMALAKPVLCYLREEDLDRFVPFKEKIPILSATKETLYDRLVEMIEDPSRRARIGEESRRYVEEVHDPIRIAERLIRVYQGKGLNQGLGPL